MRVRLLAVASMTALTACSADTKSSATDSAATAKAAPAPAPAVITIVAKDFSYEAPDTVTGGVVTIKLVNQGPDLHHIQFIRLTDGKTAADVATWLKTMKPTDAPPTWAHEVAGPNSPVPGGESLLTEALEPGNYAILCAIPAPDGIPHVMKGMIRGLTVLAPTGATAALPVADVSVKMMDYAWEITPALTAGKHVIKIENGAEQSHEMFIAQLSPGKTAADLAAWFEKPNGPPPGKPLGGISAMGKGGVVYLPVDLAPGEYGVYCFVPDAKDGKPHLAHGMVRQVTVQ